MDEKAGKMKATNFDIYLKQQLKDRQFAERFRNAGEAWDVALKLAALRKQAGLSQQELARRLDTTQQQISRLESPSYEGHSLSMLRRVASELNAEIEITFRPTKTPRRSMVAEPRARYKRPVKKPR
jgi:DNA-binding XRE family transcriptional regulator